MKALDPVGGSRHMMRLYYWGQSLEYYASDAEFLRRNIVAVYTTLSDNHLPEKATVSSILKAYEVLNVPFNYDKFEALSQEFHLEYKKPLKDLSTGNQKITAFLLALAREPKILLLDELTANLAPLFKEKVWNLVSEFCTTDTAVLFSTHEESDVRALHPDYITLLSHMNVVQTYDGMSWDDVISAMGQEEDLL
jgi:ABC-type multidrug transport system ATPase subunit